MTQVKETIDTNGADQLHYAGFGCGAKQTWVYAGDEKTFFGGSGGAVFDGNGRIRKTYTAVYNFM